MADYTIKISEGNSKAVALLAYLKTLDFVELTKTTDWWGEISEENKSSITKGLSDIKSGLTHSNKEVGESIRQKLLNAKKG